MVNILQQNSHFILFIIIIGVRIPQKNRVRHSFCFKISFLFRTFFNCQYDLKTKQKLT